MSHHTFATGEQFRIQRGNSQAVVTELAGCLRLFAKDGVQLTESFGDDAIPPGGSGILLAPWPNRVADGKWMLDGKVQKLDITELTRGHASHGLLRNSSYRAVSRSEDAVELEAEIFPQHGYPFRLTHRVRYALDGEGDLAVTQTLVNHSAAPAPVALGAHPYLRLGDTEAAELTLTVPGATYLQADERLIPSGSAPAEGAADLRGGTAVGRLGIVDRCYTDLEPVRDSRAETTLAAADGRSVTLWQEAPFGYTHIFVTDTFPGRELAVAVEPMTAPANALNSGDGLVWLEPGGSFGGSWGISARLHADNAG
jgi:aldose 1-epimerase